MSTEDNSGVFITPGNIEGGLTVIPFADGYVALSFLPLSHSFERTTDYVYFLKSCPIAYAESVATVPKNMLEVRPEVFVSVPRVYEKVLARVQENVAASSPIKQKIFAWAAGVAR